LAHIRLPRNRPNCLTIRVRDKHVVGPHAGTCSGFWWCAAVCRTAGVARLQEIGTACASRSVARFGSNKPLIAPVEPQPPRRIWNNTSSRPLRHTSRGTSRSSEIRTGCANQRPSGSVRGCVRKTRNRHAVRKMRWTLQPSPHSWRRAPSARRLELEQVRLSARVAGTSTFQFEVHGPPCYQFLRAGIEADSLSIADTRARSCWGAEYRGRDLFKRRDNSCSSSSRALQFAQVCRWARIFSASSGSSALSR
jgi:hypothetical protein